MIKRYIPVVAVVTGLFIAISISFLALGPAIPVLTYSVFKPYNLEDGVGILVLAPSGSHHWETAVDSAADSLRSRFPTEVAFGETNVLDMRVAAEKLKIRGANRIIIVPLMTSSHSPVAHRMRHVLGLDGSSSPIVDAVHPMPSDVSFVVSRPMDASPLLASAISERARLMSVMPSNETLIVVSETPPAGSDSALWQNDSNKLSSIIKAESGFRRVVFISAPNHLFEIHGRHSSDAFRRTVNTYLQDGKVVVVPLALGDSDLGIRVKKSLGGIKCNLTTRPLLPDPKMVEWMRESIDRELVIVNWKRIVDNDLVLET